jgi:excisionase family DNA binding protein
VNETFPSNDSVIYNKTGAADFLKVKPRTIDEWMHKRRIPYSKLPSGAVRFRRDQLIEFLRTYEVAAYGMKTSGGESQASKGVS